MNTTLKCERCGAPTLGPDPLGGLGNLCPRCVLGFAMDEPTLPLGPAAPGLKQGATLGNYEILDTLGRGGMGVVYRARHIGLDREVALKVLTPANAGDAEFVERFRREAKTLAALSHPNIVQIHDSGFIGDVAYLAMEFVDGVNLRQLIAEKRLPPEEALLIVPQLCDALEYAHSTGIVHRDIKPENILIDKTGKVKIADFGLAKIVRGAASHHGLTNTNVTMGTPHYMAPEQVENTSTVDHRADIFSMGVVFYEMLTGELPIGRFGLPSRRPGVNSRLDQIVLKALENKPADRYQRASHVKDAISRIGSPGAMMAPQPAEPLPASPWLTIVTLLMGIITFMVIVFALNGGAIPQVIIVSGMAAWGLGGYFWLTRNTSRVETTPRLPLSRMAVSGFILSISSVAFPVALAASGSKSQFLGCFLVVGTYLPGLALSICGIIATATVRGGRRGLGFAVAGTIICVGWILFGVGFLGISQPMEIRADNAPAETRPWPMMVRCESIPEDFGFFGSPARTRLPGEILARIHDLRQDDIYPLVSAKLPQDYLARNQFHAFFRTTIGIPGEASRFELLGFETATESRIIVVPKTPSCSPKELQRLEEHFALQVDR